MTLKRPAIKIDENRFERISILPLVEPLTFGGHCARQLTDGRKNTLPYCAAFEIACSQQLIRALRSRDRRVSTVPLHQDVGGSQVSRSSIMGETVAPPKAGSWCSGRQRRRHGDQITGHCRPSFEVLSAVLAAW